VVLMSIGVGDVGAEAVEEAGDGGDQALAVGAVDEEDDRVGHGRNLGQRGGEGEGDRGG
jgi:hypothetical protein